MKTEKISALQEVVAGEDGAAAREQIRALIEAVVLIPSPADPKTPLAVEVQGELAAMLAPSLMARGYVIGRWGFGCGGRI